MKLLEHPNSRSTRKPKQNDRFTFITNDCVKLVIPVGPRFQAQIPSWTRPSDKNESDTSKWIGIPIWPQKGTTQEDTNGRTIGRGRSDICECASPGSIECIRKHVSDKKSKLKTDLGPAFWKWKFNDMGEGVGKVWSLEEQKKFECVVKTNAASQGRSFIKSGLQCLPCQSKETIVSYYLNVYIPRRMSVQTRSGCTMVDTDDDSEEIPPPIKGSRKRLQANTFGSSSPSKYIKRTYLTTRR